MPVVIITGRIIKSDTIKLGLVLPAYLDGVKDPNGACSTYGFSFVTEDFNVGAGLGGANFITINSAKAPLYIDVTPPISNTGANLLPINLKVDYKMGDKFPSTVNAFINFVAGEQPTADKFNALVARQSMGLQV